MSTTARRPRDRRQRIASAAGRLFRERGFPNVSMADIAREVEITPGALYRHFRGKQELLAFVVREGAEAMDRLADDSAHLDALLTNMARNVAEDRGLVLLWQREARHLPEAERRELAGVFRAVVARYAALLRAARPELSEPDALLLAWSMVGVFSSLATLRPGGAARARTVSVLVELAGRVANCPLAPAGSADGTPGNPGTAALLGGSRREELLTEAIRLFDQRGFQSVSNEEIGAAVGATGPSLYKHFASKTDLLVAAVVRGGERRQAGTTQALTRAADPRDAMERLLRSYVDFALAERHLIGVLATELDALPEQQRRGAVQVQRDYLDLWERVTGAALPELDPARVRVTVRAVLAAVDTVARTRSLASRPDADRRLAEIGSAVLFGT